MVELIYSSTGRVIHWYGSDINVTDDFGTSITTDLAALAVSLFGSHSLLHDDQTYRGH